MSIPALDCECEPEWLLTVPAAARLIGVSAASLYRMLQAGRISAIKMGASRRIPRDELERFVRLQWIPEHVKGPEDLPLVVKDQVFRVAR